MYVLRSDENAAAITAEQNEFMAQYQAAYGAQQAGSKDILPLKMPQPGQWTDPRPGDALVDRDLKNVYYVDVDGSRRRVDASEAKQAAIDEVKRQLAELKKMQEDAIAKQAAEKGEPRVIHA